MKYEFMKSVSRNQHKVMEPVRNTGGLRGVKVPMGCHHLREALPALITLNDDSSTGQFSSFL